jgi:hypothetical protein
MTDPATLQVQSELAEDTIGLYIGRLSAMLAEMEPRRDPSELRTVLWLEGELRLAGADRARLFEYREAPDRLAGLIDLYHARLAALDTWRSHLGPVRLVDVPAQTAEILSTSRAKKG